MIWNDITWHNITHHNIIKTAPLDNSVNVSATAKYSSIRRLQRPMTSERSLTPNMRALILLLAFSKLLSIFPTPLRYPNLTLKWKIQPSKMWPRVVLYTWSDIWDEYCVLRFWASIHFILEIVAARSPETSAAFSPVHTASHSVTQHFCSIIT